MAGQTVLKVLLRERHMQEHQSFCREYEKTARTIDPALTKQKPSKATFYRWLGGNIQGLPHPGPCQVLEKMFPDWTVVELFEQWDSSELPTPPRGQREPAVAVGTSDSLLSGIPSSMPISSLAGYWVTCFKFDGVNHQVDISNLMPKSLRQASVSNFPPTPRSDSRMPGFRNALELELVGRHLIGTWKNATDNYYFGSLHLAILPGENVLEGCYTGFENDVTVVTDRWKWVRLDSASLQGVDLSRVTLIDPREAYNLIEKYSFNDAPIKLQEVVEG